MAAVAEVGGTELMADLELPVVDVLAGLEKAGIAVDLDKLRRLFQLSADATEADVAVNRRGR